MGFLGQLAAERANVKKEDRAQKFQDLLFQQKQAAQDLQNQVAQSQIGENNARADALRNPPPSYQVVSREDGTYLLDTKTGKEMKTTLPGTPDPVKNAVAVAQATKGIPTYADLHPKPDQTIVPVQEPEGGVVYETRANAIGRHAPSPNATGKAAIQKDVASNRTQLSVIDDALAELNRHPDAVGLKRGMGDLVPFMGGVSDKINQTLDPGGVAARASLANISSMVIKDRSGSAVTVSEYPRLKPFVPTALDDPAAIRIKLTKLKAAIQRETDLLQQSSGMRGGTQSSGDINLAAPETPKNQGHPAKPKADADAILAKYGIK